jgi:hypothetical protein
MTQPAHTDDWTEAYDADIQRVDLVKTSANGSTFLLMKAGEGAGLMTPEAVEALIKSASIPTPRDVFAAKETPVTAPAAPETAVVKAGDDLDPTVILADPDQDAPGDPNDPGSPAWEAIDAATAMKWSTILSRAKNALCTLADREDMEALTADPDDAENAWDLQDASCAIDYAISVLAPYAVGEQAEIDNAEAMVDAMDSITKAAAAVSPDDLNILEFASELKKSGKVLSASNEAQIRTAAESLQNVLSSLPQAEEAPVTKTAAAQPETPAVTPVEPVAAQVPVVKAKGDPQMAVFDASGNLVGTIDPADMSPIAAPTPPAGGDAQGADAEPTPTDDAAAATTDATDPAVAADPTAGSATIPGTDTVQSPVDDGDDETVAKAAAVTPITAQDVVSAFTEALKGVGINEAVMKAAGSNLEERIARLEAQPAPGGPLLNGGTGIPGPVTHAGGTEQDALAPLRKAAADETDPAKKRALEYALGVELIKAGQTAKPAPAKPLGWEDVLTRFGAANASS